MNTPLVSFLVPCYNHARYLSEALESILQQSETDDYEILVEDDASPDHTPEVVRAFSDPRIQYQRHTTNLGQVPTLNRIVARARGKYLVRLDGDNRYHPNFLAALLPCLEQDANIGMVYCDTAAIDADGRLVTELWQVSASRAQHKGKAFRGNELCALLFDNFIPCLTALARREVWREGYPLPEWFPPIFLADDWYLNLRMARHYDFVYVPCVLADYRLHPQNLHRRGLSDNSYERTVRHILDELFAEPERAAEKERVRVRAYGHFYTQLADRYFAESMLNDARRCYWTALRYEPPRAFKPAHLRRLFATYLGMERYRALKRVRGLH